MADEVLSQSEIDQLLAAFASGDASVEEMKAEPEKKKVKNYDFKRPDKFSKDQIRTLEMLHDNFARMLNTYLSTTLRCLVTVEVASVEQTTYQEFVQSLANPCKLAGTLRKQTDVDPKTKIHFLTHEQFNRLIQHIKRPDKKTLFLLLFYSGLRIGEALVLRPQDFDFISNTLTVSRTLSRSETSNVINPPKSKAGNRIITLPSHLMDMLKSLIATNRIDKGQLLFELINRETARRTLVNALKSAGLPKIRIHDLRHSHASLLIELGFSPVAIKERLGHENIQITLDTYSHLYPSKQSEIADKLNSIMENSTE